MRNIISVLIPTITGREELFTTIVNSFPDYVNVVYCKDNKEMSIGAKRQLLLNNCDTPYFVMLDDDDRLADDYFSIIMPNLKYNPDCVCYLEHISTGKVAIHSNRFSDWGEGNGYDYYRTPFYKDVLRTDIAKQIGFSDLRFGEDYDFSMRLKQSGLIKNEIFVDKPMYFYNMPVGLTKAQSDKRYGIK